MLFNSYIFILLFLPIVLIGYYILNHCRLYEVGKLFLIGMSLWFYGYFNTYYLTILIVSILANYLLFRIQESLTNHRWKLILMWFSALANIGSIFYFKYFDFFLTNINGVFKTDFPLKNILLPLGISFFTFQQVSFQIDSYRGETKGYKIIDYALFVSFFPQLIAGPIVLHNEMIPQFQDASKKKFNLDNFGFGISLFILGLAKKVLIADVFGRVVDNAFGDIGQLNLIGAAVVMLSYTFQIYFDFSGYCDMAIGLGRMFNIDIPVNFNSPYKSKSIMEFWQRWHITLTRFFTTYLYIPLGGNRKGKVRTYLNNFFVFLVSGLWHGASWTFVIWGGLHGAALILNKMIKKQWDKVPKLISWGVTFLFINVTWVLFRAGSISQTIFFFKRFFTMGVYTFTPALQEFGGRIKMFIYFIIAFVLSVLSKNALEITNKFKFRWYEALALSLLFVLSLLSFSGVSSFLYFNF